MNFLQNSSEDAVTHFNQSVIPEPPSVTPPSDPKSFLGVINDGEFSSAEQDMVGTGIGAAADITTGIIEGVSTQRAFESAQKEARYLAEQNRQDQLSAQSLQNSIRTQQAEMAEKEMALNKLTYNNKRKFQMFLKEFEKNLELRQNKDEIISKVFDEANNDKKKRNALIKMWSV